MGRDDFEVFSEKQESTSLRGALCRNPIDSGGSGSGEPAGVRKVRFLGEDP